MFITLFNIQYTTVLPKKVPLFEYLSMKAACATSPTVSCTATCSKSAWLYLTMPFNDEWKNGYRKKKCVVQLFIFAGLLM